IAKDNNIVLFAFLNERVGMGMPIAYMHTYISSLASMRRLAGSPSSGLTITLGVVALVTLSSIVVMISTTFKQQQQQEEETTRQQQEISSQDKHGSIAR